MPDEWDEWEEGLHDSLVTREIERELTALRPGLRPQTQELADAEVADRLSRHVAEILARAITDLPDATRTEQGAGYLAAVVARLAEAAGLEDADDLGIVVPPKLLRAVLRVLPTGDVAPVAQPLTPLSDTTLLTNAAGDPAIAHELRAEIDSAHSIDMVIAFIRRSGLLPLLPQLRRHGEAGKPLRVLTTTYTGTTEPRALEELVELGAQVKVSYDLSSTRLHAKAWIFRRSARTTTAYLGSSNLTHTAQHDGLEWNVRLSAARNPEVIDKMRAAFDVYWNSADFIDYDREDFRRRTASSAPASEFSPLTVELRSYQEAILERIAVARSQGHHRNLLVAATGTGKTVMAAVDYARLARNLPRARLLFVAHREELLRQARQTFTQALQDRQWTAEMWVRGSRPQHFDHVFASIQSLSRADLDLLEPDHFDVVVIDEFHHAAAPTYEALLDRVAPVELLGLTATPERADGLDILRHFDGRIAAELRLWDAIAGGYLTPFAYYGVHDDTDLSSVPWRRGRGYDPAALTNVLTADHAWANLVLNQVRALVTDPSAMRAIGFCVSVAHARFMAERFVAAGIPAVAVHADTPSEDRERSLRDLRAGRLKAVFAVDLFNEGVDVPEVDTLLMLRPTDSGLLFIQQLGRGLRRSDTKSVCTVLDFVAQHRKEFRYDQRYGALLGGTSRKEVQRQVSADFPFLPAGCSIQLDRVAQEVVLRSIRSSLPGNVTERAAELRSIGDFTLGQFLEESGLDLDDIYAGGHSWSGLRRRAGLPTAPEGPDERLLLGAGERLLHLDDDLRLDTYRRWLSSGTPIDPTALDAHGVRLAKMLLSEVVTSKAVTTIVDAAQLVWRHPQVRAELVELLDVLEARIGRLGPPIRAELPLRVHARYTRNEIQAAFDRGGKLRFTSWREGVLSVDGPAEVFAFTLDKTAGSFSPSTRYKDYAISPQLIHWETQAATSPQSKTGQRYIDHVGRGVAILLFARLSVADRAFWCLGPATYVRHEGSRPIAITWRLQHRLPGDLFSAFAAAVV